MWIPVLIVCTQFFQGTQSQSVFNPFPLNQAVLSGVTTNFTCGTTSSSGIVWYNSTCYPVPSTCPASDIHFYGNPNPGRYNVTNSTVGGTIISTLTVTQSQSTDAGIFVCQQQVSANVTLVGIAQLIVIEQMSNCTSNGTSSLVENDTVVLSCSVMFSGNDAPVMQFKDGNSVVTNGVTNNTIPNQRATYKLQFLASRSLYGTSFSCRTYFDQPTSVSSEQASNIPSYDQTTDCPTLPKVMYRVENIAISPIQSQYNPGESISCEAGGNPPPSYTWTNINNTANQPGVGAPQSTLSITWSMAGTNQTYTCIASNTVAGKMFSISQTITFYVTTATTTATTKTNPSALNTTPIIIGVVVGVGGALLVIFIVVVVVCCVRRKRQTATKPPKYVHSATTNTSDIPQYEQVVIATPNGKKKKVPTATLR